MLAPSHERGYLNLNFWRLPRFGSIFGEKIARPDLVIRFRRRIEQGIVSYLFQSSSKGSRFVVNISALAVPFDLTCSSRQTLSAR